MAIKKFKIDLHPTIQDYEYIYTWMKEAFEKKLPNSGLFHNLHKEDFEKGKIIVYRHEGKAEAIMTYGRYDQEVTFYIMSLNPQFHHQGIGTRFMIDVLNYFRKKGCIVADFYEATKKGYRLIKHLGAKKKEDPYHPEEYMFIKIVPSRRQNWVARRRLVVWKDTPFGESMPDFSWSLNFDKNKIPILTYAFYDWYFGIVQDDEIIYQGKIKDIRKLLPSFTGDYLYIKSDFFPTNK